MSIGVSKCIHNFGNVLATRTCMLGDFNIKVVFDITGLIDVHVLSTIGACYIWATWSCIIDLLK